MRALIDQAVSHHGRLDGAFNNEGMEHGAVPLSELRRWDFPVCGCVLLCNRVITLAGVELLEKARHPDRT
jgi:NAD(P)-dependent dehydrogenase (short-subunit alcohol dehydrogenase family)